MKAGRITLALAVLFLYSVFAGAAFAATANDSILSQHIKEADGTSGQDTNSGSGIKTGHIQNNSVTTGKIADGAVTTSKIAVSAVTNAKVADGAVTDAKITGPISASKISSTGLNADTVDGKHAADLAPAVHTHPTSQVTGLDATLAVKAEIIHTHSDLAPLNHTHTYARVYTVSLPGGGGEYESLYDAAVAAQNNCGIGAPCLIKVMPGIHDIGGNEIYLSTYVDLEGSGENVTVIRGAGTRVIYGNGAGVEGVNEVRSLTVENYGSAPTLNGIVNISNIRNATVNIPSPGAGQDSYGIYESWKPTVALTDVKVVMSTAGPNAIVLAGGSSVLSNVSVVATTAGAVAYGIKVTGGGTARISNSNIQVASRQYAYGIETYGSTAHIKNTTIDANIPNPMYQYHGGYGISAQQSSSAVYIDHSSVYGSGRYILQNAGNVFVAYSKVDGGRTGGGLGVPKCIGAYDSIYNLYADSTCGLAP